MTHLPAEVLLRFILGAASRPENHQVVRHLLARCPACASTLRRLRREPPLSPPPSPEDYDPAFEHAEAFVVQLLTRKPAPPDRLKPAAAEADRRPDSAASANAARRRWLFG